MLRERAILDPVIDSVIPMLPLRQDLPGVPEVGQCEVFLSAGLENGEDGVLGWFPTPELNLNGKSRRIGVFKK